MDAQIIEITNQGLSCALSPGEGCQHRRAAEAGALSGNKGIEVALEIEEMVYEVMPSSMPPA
jgi:hypothetical protein